MPLPVPGNPDPFRRLVDIMEALLSPEGCPWDRKQSHQTLKPYALEETYEVLEAIDQGDMDELCGELGDLGLQIVFHAALARRNGSFNIDDVYTAICDKLIRRHPHVFGDVVAEEAGTVLRNWEAIKKQERAAKGKSDAPPSALDGIPSALPALQRATRLQSKAARVGFDWKDVAPVLAKIREEIDELEAEMQAHGALESTPDGEATHSRDHMEGELGDLLFAIVNLARFLQVDAEQALQRTNRKFHQRFLYIEKKLRESHREPADSTLEEMDAFWNQAKREGVGES